MSEPKSEGASKQASWRDVLPIHPAAELFPLLAADKLRGLGEDIKKNGLHTHITVWKALQNSPPELLDARNRLDAMELVGFTIEVENVGSDADPAIRMWMRESPKHMPMRIEIVALRGDRPGGDPYTYVISANIHRRHLTDEQRRDLIAKLIKQTPEKSDRQIAEQAKSNRTTVGQIRKQLEDTGACQSVDTRTDRDGRKQPAHKRRRALIAKLQSQQGKMPPFIDPVTGGLVDPPINAKAAVKEAVERAIAQRAGNGVDPEADQRKAEAAKIEADPIEVNHIDPAADRREAWEARVTGTVTSVMGMLGCLDELVRSAATLAEADALGEGMKAVADRANAVLGTCERVRAGLAASKRAAEILPTAAPPDPLDIPDYLRRAKPLADTNETKH
jgi:hypothetical protein